MPTLTRFKFIAVITLVIAFSPSLIAAQVLGQVDSLVVVDANQNRVGKVIDNSRGGIPEVAFKVGDIVFVLKTLKMSFVGGGLGEFSHEAVWFDNFGCSGQAFIEPFPQPHGLPNSVRIVPQAAVGPDGGTVYVEDADGELNTDFQALSVLRVRDNVISCEDQGGPTATNPVLPTIKLANMFDHFTPPFSLQAEAGQDLTALQQQVDDLTTQVDTLSDENAMLQQQLSDLGEDFTGHTHTYQTGRFRFHNSVTATTGPAIPASP